VFVVVIGAIEVLVVKGLLLASMPLVVVFEPGVFTVIVVVKPLIKTAEPEILADWADAL
jgi:hypothetical protein